MGYSTCTISLPGNVKDLQNRLMQPAFERAGLEWKSLYAGRRGLGTLLYEKSPQAAQATLRHLNLRTTESSYVKTIDSTERDGRD